MARFLPQARLPGVWLKEPSLDEPGDRAGGTPPGRTPQETTLRRNRYFHITFWAQACTDYCDQFLVVALTWGALHRLSGTDLGVILACWTVPRGVTLLLSGVFVDRWDRRTIAV